MKINNPHKKIAVIGAGPAGIFAAVELQNAGYQDITIYGVFEEAQCRTLKIDGVVADVGTCYVHSGYFNTIKSFVERYNIQITYLTDDAKSVSSADIHTPVSPTTAEKVLTYLGLLYYLLHSVLWKFLHNTWFGRFLYGMSFEKYLKNVGLGKLAGSFVFGPGGVAQGYGFLNDVSAYRLFRWFRPSIFLTPILNKRKKGTGIIAEGYGTLFRRAYDSIAQQKAQHIRSVMPHQDGSVRVEDDLGQEHCYDTVIVACPLTSISTPISAWLNPSNVQSTPLFSYLWASNEAPHFKDRVYIMDYINDEKTDVISTFRLWGQTDSGQYLYWGVGYSSGNLDQEALRKKIEHQVNDEIRLKVEATEFFAVFDYNLRFSAAAIRDGLHRKIRKAQGKDNIWYSGGLLSHWDVDSIHEFSRTLVDQLILRNNLTWFNTLLYFFRRVKGFFINV